MATLVAVRFVFPHVLAPRAQQVSLVSSFNGWDPHTHLLTRTLEG